MTKTISLLFFILTSTIAIAIAQSTQKPFNFDFEEITLNGVLNLPATTPFKGIFLIVHSSGQTNAVAQDWYEDVRATLVEVILAFCLVN
ncbi:MAG: hypothetical protein AB8G22_22670 [Saprospiraceae bacterium]